MQSAIARFSKLLVRLSAVVFVANVVYFYLLMQFGSKRRNAATGQVIPFSNHGYRVFITHTQYSIFIGSLIVVAVLFLLGVITYEMNKKRSR